MSDLTLERQESAMWRQIAEMLPPGRPGDIVILDRLSVHKKKSVLALIEAAGAKVLLLPRATPELNPIEHCWSKIKAILRRLAPRTSEALEHAILAALACVNKADVWGFFAGCGYV